MTHKRRLILRRKVNANDLFLSRSSWRSSPYSIEVLISEGVITAKEAQDNETRARQQAARADAKRQLSGAILVTADFGAGLELSQSAIIRRSLISAPPPQGVTRCDPTRGQTLPRRKGLRQHTNDDHALIVTI